VSGEVGLFSPGRAPWGRRRTCRRRACRRYRSHSWPPPGRTARARRRYLGRARRVQAAVVPHHPHLGARALGAERVGDPRAGRRRFLEGGVDSGSMRAGSPRSSAQLGGVHDVACHVTERARAEVPKPAPFERYVRGLIRPLRRRTEPQVPVERRRHIVLLERPVDGLRRQIGRFVQKCTSRTVPTRPPPPTRGSGASPRAHGPDSPSGS